MILPQAGVFMTDRDNGRVGDEERGNRAGHSHRQNPGVGTYFFDSVFSDVDSLVLYGGKHTVRFGFYRMVASRFPYLVFYKVEDDVVVVFRILPGRRDPNWIRLALRASEKKK